MVLGKGEQSCERLWRRIFDTDLGGPWALSGWSHGVY